jgi:hypothetical protein
MRYGGATRCPSPATLASASSVTSRGLPGSSGSTSSSPARRGGRSGSPMPTSRGRLRTFRRSGPRRSTAWTCASWCRAPATSRCSSRSRALVSAPCSRPASGSSSGRVRCSTPRPRCATGCGAVPGRRTSTSSAGSATTSWTWRWRTPASPRSWRRCFSPTSRTPRSSCSPGGGCEARCPARGPSECPGRCGGARVGRQPELSGWGTPSPPPSASAARSRVASGGWSSSAASPCCCWRPLGDLSRVSSEFPVAAVLGWLGLSLLWKAWRLRKSPQPTSPASLPTALDAPATVPPEARPRSRGLRSGSPG